MEKKVTIIFDEPLKLCAKLWVIKQFQEIGCKTKVIDIKYKISNIEQRGKAGKIAARVLTLLQSVRAMACSSKGGIVFCWSQWSALFVNMLPGAASRYIISYNWLTPQPNRKTRFLYVKALGNPHFAAITNATETKEKLLKAYGARDIGNIWFIPDVFDDNEIFKSSSYIEEERYCFIGGRANRDWELFLEIARDCMDISFIAVAARSDWKKEWVIPENVTVKFDTSFNEYYELLEKAFLTIYPLKENKVSGLINIIKSVQLGKLVLTTKLEVTEMYYPNTCSDFLISIGDKKKWVDAINRIYAYDKTEYEERFDMLKNHITERFSPGMAGRKLSEILRALEMTDS